VTVSDEHLQHRQGQESLKAFSLAATTAAAYVVYGDPDELIVLANACPTLPDEQHDDSVRAVAAIDVLRYLVEHYEETQKEDDDG
jgi:hypothetical protein